MKNEKKKRAVRLPSPALVVALVALFVALSGGAAAGTALVSRQAASNASASAPASLVQRVTALEKSALVSRQAASNASASGPASLVRRVTALEKKVNALQKQSNQTVGAFAGLALWSVCDAVTTADALQGTWQTIDQLSAATQAGKTYFGPQTPVDDTVFGGHHACAIIPTGRSHLVPPNVGSFNALVGVFH